MIKHVKGNLLDSKCDVIAHCVNCQGVMGAGIALQIKNKWPNVFKGYKRFIDKNTTPLGKCVIVADKNIAVANLFGQDTYGKEKRQVNYEAIYTAMDSCKKLMEQENWASIGFPKNMASDLAGGDWRIIEKMIECIFEDFEVEIVEYTR